MTNPLAVASVPEMIRSLANAAPDLVAMECGAESITYGELWAESANAAARISSGPNYRPGGLVATLFERGTACVIEQLAAWRSGCAYLPLEPALPDGRLRYILADARPQSIEVSPHLRQRLGADARLSGVFDEKTAGTAACRAGEDATAYVIYTSGSTGVPKGVAVGHNSLANLVSWHRETYLTGPGARVAAFAGLGFDASAWECWSTLACGATLVLPPGPVAGDIARITEFLTAQKIDLCFLSTPLAEQLFVAQEVPSHLRVLNTGGDRLRVYPPKDFPAAVHNHYGPTEATVVTTATGDLRKSQRDALPPIGRPVRGAEVRLVNDSGGDVAEPGVDGELLIGGSILATGYWNDSRLTADKFIAEQAGGRWYRSGDICRWASNGDLEFVGRRDGQISLRGLRIELAEIEIAILAGGGVRQAAVMHQGGGDGGRLLAFFCGEVEEAAIRAHLLGMLPRYMVPAIIRRVGSIPLTVNGKIDHASLVRSLPEAATDVVLQESVTSAHAVSQEEGDIFIAIAEIWGGLLGVSPGPDDDFFAIGGHSLLAARVTGQVRKDLGINIGLEVLFEFPVLMDYVNRVKDSHGRNKPGSL
ncbi:non-ribosomal peptide synthetase [Sphaerimonospora cavernae]|uniref:Non-ribosomal peptide synthetase n=1 Tax=Sphaerimonospora cavernae TaxID=1740611 RepID=A0ABV6U2V2_9ACTN